MSLKSTLQTLLRRENLPPGATRNVMETIMDGHATPAQIGAFLIALRAKGESVSEVAIAAEVLRARATHIQVSREHLVDTCGTGGDGAHTFNISTTSAFVAAAGGARVAKHGNRSVSSHSGSADVLEAAGVNLDLTPEQVTTCIERIGIGFLFGPQFHQALRHVAPVRRELGVRTLFNLLGPLLNPAGATRQVIGVYAQEWVLPMAKVLQQLGAEHVLVVHAEDGLDEISIAGPTQIAELRNDSIRCYSVVPEQFGLTHAPLNELSVESASDSVAILRSVLDGTLGPARDIVCLNAGAALYAADVADSLAEGIGIAGRAIDSGAARRKLDELVALSQSFRD